MVTCATTVPTTLHAHSLNNCLNFLCLSIEFSQNSSECDLGLLHVLKCLFSVLVLEKHK